MLGGGRKEWVGAVLSTVLVVDVVILMWCNS